MIGVDWGTSSLRAYRLAADGQVLDRREGARGILTVPPGGFPAVLEEVAGTWLDEGEDQVLLSGMVGSRQGWQEAPYLSCPAGAPELGAALLPIAVPGRPAVRARIVPGLSCLDRDGIPDVMRGEEVQVVGTLGSAAGALACMPGSHSKWVRIENGRVAGFTTHMTGEAFAALRGHTILGRMMADGSTDQRALLDGARRAAQEGGLLHHLFGVRALGLFGQLPEASAASFLSGLLIGHEVASAAPDASSASGTEPIHLIGAESLCSLYSTVLSGLGHRVQQHSPDAAASGLWQIGRNTAWT